MVQNLKTKYKQYLEKRIYAWTGLSSNDVLVFRTNRLVVFILICGFTLLAAYLYSFYPRLTTLLNDGFLFFHFPKIFNLKIPEQGFFERISQIFLASLIIFHWIQIEFYLFKYFFSCLYIAKEQKMIVFVESNFFTRKVHILKNRRLQYEMQDNLFLRIFGVANLKLSFEGQVWEIRYLSRAKLALNEIIAFEKK